MTPLQKLARPPCWYDGCPRIRHHHGLSCWSVVTKSKILPPIFLSDAPGISYSSVCINCAASRFGFEASFPNILVTSFDSFYYRYCIDICYSHVFSNIFITFMTRYSVTCDNEDTNFCSLHLCHFVFRQPVTQPV